MKRCLHFPSMPSAFILAAIVATAAGFAQGADNGVARTPPMGWNSWNKFGCNVNEQLIREIADALVSSGMRDAGYRYVVIDDCWQIGRDSAGNILADPARFPSGMGALAAYVHSKGLKFGLYSDAGTLTCQQRPGGRGYEFQDARQYAAWGVDYLKYDWCSHGSQNSEASYAIMHEALVKSGRPIVFSICEWGSTQPWLWAKDIGNLWRTTGDIQDCWDCKKDWGGMGFTHILDLQTGLAAYAGPGHWNDPDMLEVGNGGMTATEYRAHFSLWCMLAAPLMAGNDIRSMTGETAAILTNPDLVAIDQDTLGAEGTRVRKDGDREVWARQLADGSKAVALFNRAAEGAPMSVAWSDIGYPNHLTASVRDLWAHKELGKHAGGISSMVPGHGVVMLKVSP